MKSLNCVRLFATPWTVAHEVPPSLGFSRQEDWSGLPFPSPGDLPNTGIEPRSPALQADALPSEPPGKSSFPKENKSWIFIGKIDVKAEPPTLCPHDGKSWLTWKDPDTGKDWRQKEKGMIEDEMVECHHQFYGHEFD